jgi:prefoldin subunit 5
LKNFPDRIEQVAKQRDHLVSLLSEADAKIIELYDRIAELEQQLPASNIISLDPRGPKRL